ncbi:MAG TPA: crossover junction endodeoxyribonuclease RuvC [Thermodesulfobacteriota bacterium]|nr:crossover junction endodeoxyribonuclease RuvC [Thermodesulfobacteriota bacterium]
MIYRHPEPMIYRQPGRTLGIDPGSQVTGFGVLEKEGNRIKHVCSNFVRLTSSPSPPLPLRLKQLHQALSQIIQEFRPTDLAVEKVFFAKNVHSALTLGHVRGVVLFTAVESGLEVFEYSPLEIKKAVTGYGRADKKQVQEMVKLLLGIPASQNQDISDALAAGICHLNWFYPLKDL